MKRTHGETSNDNGVDREFLYEYEEKARKKGKEPRILRSRKTAMSDTALKRRDGEDER